MLSDFVAYLPSPVRALEVDVDGKIVSIVAVPRAVGIMPCIEHGEQVHYLRIGEETRRMASSNVADLLLGRRQRAVVTVSA